MELVLRTGAQTEERPDGGPLDLRLFDTVAICVSGGIDSQAALDVVVERADIDGLERSALFAIHADLGEYAWPGTLEVVREQVANYGLRLEVLQPAKPDMVATVTHRKRWPSPMRRWCTSEYKTWLYRKAVAAYHREAKRQGLYKDRQMRVLVCQGIRAEESPRRAKIPHIHPLNRRPWGRAKGRDEWRWLPVHRWTKEETRQRAIASGTRVHSIYAEGLPRASCQFCPFASRSALLLAGHLNPELLARFAEAERVTERSPYHISYDEIEKTLAMGYVGGEIEDWKR